MKSLQLNLAKKLLILDYGSKEKLDQSWDFFCAFGKQRIFWEHEMILKPIIKGTFMTEEDYRSLITDEDGGISISKYPLAYKISYSRHKNAFKDAIEKQGFYWLENPNGQEPHNIGLIKNYPTGHPLMDISLKEAIDWKATESRTLKFPIIFEILE